MTDEPRLQSHTGPNWLARILTGFGYLFAIPLFFMAIKIVQEYERGVIFRLGRLVGARGPGLFFILPFVERMVKVDLRVVTMDVPRQDVCEQTPIRNRRFWPPSKAEQRLRPAGRDSLPRPYGRRSPRSASLRRGEPPCFRSPVAAWPGSPDCVRSRSPVQWRADAIVPRADRAIRPPINGIQAPPRATRSFRVARRHDRRPPKRDTSQGSDESQSRTHKCFA